MPYEPAEIYTRHELSPLFHAAHDVITELRLIDEQA